MSTDKINNRSNWIFSKVKNILWEKDELLLHNFNMTLSQTLQMFEYTGLPDTIPAKDLELQLQLNGYATITEVDGSLYSFVSGLGGEPNPYYLPTLSIVVNPYLKFNKSLTIDKDCVVVLNDKLYCGLTTFINKYASLLTEAEITLKQALINYRVPAITVVDNDKTKESANLFFEHVVNGDTYNIVTGVDIAESLYTKEFVKMPHIKEIIEGIQYIKGSRWTEIGINSVFNMKREAINEAESSMNDNTLLPLTDDLLECRRDGLNKVNKKYNTNITVDFSSAWKRIREDIQLTNKVIESEVKDNETDSNTDME